jgi:hypothetical protein
LDYDLVDDDALLENAANRYRAVVVPETTTIPGPHGGLAG